MKDIPEPSDTDQSAELRVEAADGDGATGGVEGVVEAGADVELHAVRTGSFDAGAVAAAAINGDQRAQARVAGRTLAEVALA